MSATITYGRYPTLAEVCGYYGRDDFLDFLLRTIATRRVVMVLPERRHWEPRWEDNQVRAKTRDELREWVLRQIRERFPDVPEGGPLPFYPAFHQAVERRTTTPDGDRRSLGKDGVAEADLPTWREAFHDLLTLIEALRAEGVPHHCKFSGHRSLHLMIPCAGDQWRASAFGDSKAHGVAILRMPYSLNEDTGLVSLPLTWEQLPAFRPWQANLHLVEVRDDWLREPTGEERERIRNFVRSVPGRKPVPRRAYFRPGDIRAALAARARGLQLAGRMAVDGAVQATALAWRWPDGYEALTCDELGRLLREGDAERRWLAIEAFLLHGRQLTYDVLPALLSDDDPYARPAALDLMLRFPDCASEYFVQVTRADDLWAQARAFHVLAQSDDLWPRVLTALQASPERSAALAARLAVITGIRLGDWPGAWRLVHEAERDHGEPPGWSERVAALRIAEGMSQTWGQREMTQRGLALARLGEGILDLILLGHATPDRRVRRAFLIAISLLADERALPLLVEALADPYHDNVKWATRGLVKIGTAAVPTLIEAAASDQARLRRYAVRCLGHLGDPRARETIVAALDDADDDVRRQAAIAIRQFVESAHMEPLKRAARQPTSAAEAVEALLWLGEPGRRAVEDLALLDGEPAAARWLWQRGDGRGRTLLLEALSGPPEKRDVAVQFLAEGEADEEVVEALTAHLRSVRRWERGRIVEALARSQHPKAWEALLDLARVSDRMDRTAVAKALASWDDPRSLQTLITLAADRDHKVRVQAVASLLQQGEGALSALLSAREELAKGRGRAGVEMALRSFEIRDRLDSGEPMSLDLLELIAHADANGRALASAALTQRHSPEDIAALLSALSHPRVGTRWCARELLLAIGEPARQPLERFLAGKLPEMARGAADELLKELSARQTDGTEDPEDGGDADIP